jgi:CheY-like chemotaxis protein
LALVKSLVELHGGTVQVTSAGRGCGSEFVVRLPVHAASGERLTIPAAQTSHIQSSTTCKVMIVDDNVDAAETLALLLQATGHDTCVFHDPAAALAALGEIQPDAAVLDIGLPVMDGYELGKRVHEACGDRCVLIALTGYGSETDRSRSTAAGFHHHLVKPVAPDEVLRILEAHSEARIKPNGAPNGIAAKSSVHAVGHVAA